LRLELSGYSMLPVFLHCSREEAARRVGNADRVEREGMEKQCDISRHSGPARSAGSGIQRSG